MLGSIFRQHYIGHWWGGIKMTIQQMAIYVTGVNFIMLSMTLYSSGFIQKSLGTWDLAFWQFFFGLLVVVILPSALLVFKVDMPSFFAYWWKQSWAQENPMKEELAALRQDNKALYEEMKKLRKLVEAGK